MIHSDEGLSLTIEQLARMYRVLAGLHKEIAPRNYSNYLLLAEGPLDQIRELQREIDEYLGIAEPVAASASRSE